MLRQPLAAAIYNKGLTVEQRLARLEKLFVFYDDGTIEINREVNPEATKQEVRNLHALLVEVSEEATTSPVGTPPVVVPTELLPADFTKGFTLKGFEKKEERLALQKGAVYQVKIVVDKADGGGVFAQFINPDGSGFGSPGKLVNGLNTFPITSPVEDARFFTVQANGANVVISSVSLTKV